MVASHVTNLVFGDKVDKEEGEDRITMSVFSIPESLDQLSVNYKV